MNSPKTTSQTSQTSSSLLVRGAALFHPDPSGAGGGEPSIEDLKKQVAAMQAAMDQMKKEKEVTDADLTHAINLVRLDTEPEKVEASLRRMMAKAGYSHGEIEAYIAETLHGEPPEDAVPEAPARQPAKQPAKQPQGAQGGANDGELAQVLRALASEIVDLKKEMGTMASREVGRSGKEMRTQMDTRISALLDSSKELNTIVGKLSPDASKAKETLRKDALLFAKENLKGKQRENGGRLDPAWIDEAVKEAVAEVGTRYRTVIGDPSEIGRTPETVAEATRFLKTEPVKAPEFVPGKTSLTDIREQSRAWATDTIARAMAEKAPGEESVV